MANENLIKNRSAHEDILVFLDLVVAFLSTEKMLIDFVHMAGYDLGDMDKPYDQGMTTFEKVITVTQSVRENYETIREHWPEDMLTKEGWVDVFKIGKQAFDSYKELKEVFKLAGTHNGMNIDGEKLFLHVMQQIILRAHGILFPPSIPFYRMLNWVKAGSENEVNQPEKDTTGKIIRYPYRGIQFHTEGINAFFRDPGKALKELYFNNTSTTSSALATTGQQDDLLLIRLRDLLLSLGLNAFYGFKPTETFTLPQDKKAEFAQTLTTWMKIPKIGTFDLSFRRDGQRIIVRSGYNGQKVFDLNIGNWYWTFDLGTGLAAFSFGPGGIKLEGSSGVMRFTINGTPNKDAKEGEPTYLIGSQKGTRLEIGKIDVALQGEMNGQADKADVKIKVSKSGLYIVPGDADSLLRKILPDNGISILFDLTAGYSNERGFYLEGSGGGEINIPVNKKAGGFSLPEVQLGVRKLSNSENWMLYATIVGRAAFGPVAVEVAKTGLRVQLNKPAKGATANLGIFDADIDFKSPEGVGITINAKGVTGGGFLQLDRDKGEYFGVVQLNFRNKINFKAFGIIQTKQPDGKSFFSFLLIVSAEFPPVQLGLGFSLNGVGGLIGIQRRVELQKLQDGIYKGELDDVLFPADPMKNAYGLISKINNLFPAADNHYTFGLMAKLVWGYKNIINIKLALIMEFPEPTRLIMIGLLKSEVQKKVLDKNIKALNINAAFLFAIDFDKKFIRLDAALVDSTLLGLKLEGDLAVRIAYGSNPDFAITVGGFHPSFQPPALDLPAKMRRLQIALKTGNPSITVQCYLAITANTIQFGIAGKFEFKKWGVGIKGELSFDALFQLSPFRFETNVHFLLAASWKGHDFASIEVNGAFSGPSPWKIKGELKLKFWIFSKTVSLEETWGEKDETKLEGVNVLPLVADDLRNIANWERNPGSSFVSVSLRQRIAVTDGTPVLTMHPTETLTVKQSVVPLGPAIDVFAGRRPQGSNSFNLVLKQQLGDNQVKEITGNSVVKNHFASAQFFNLSDEDKLSRSSYELFDSGISFNNLDTVTCSTFSSVEEAYELYYRDTLPLPEESAAAFVTTKVMYRQTVSQFTRSLAANAIANSPYARMATPTTTIGGMGEPYVLVNKDTLKVQANTLPLPSETEAWQLLRKMKAQDPVAQLNLTVVPKSESIA